MSLYIRAYGHSASSLFDIVFDNGWLLYSLAYDLIIMIPARVPQRPYTCTPSLLLCMLVSFRGSAARDF